MPSMPTPVPSCADQSDQAQLGVQLLVEFLQSWGFSPGTGLPGGREGGGEAGGRSGPRRRPTRVLRNPPPGHLPLEWARASPADSPTPARGLCAVSSALTPVGLVLSGSRLTPRTLLGATECVGSCSGGWGRQGGAPTDRDTQDQMGLGPGQGWGASGVGGREKGCRVGVGERRGRGGEGRRAAPPRAHHPIRSGASR